MVKKRARKVKRMAGPETPQFPNYIGRWRLFRRIESQKDLALKVGTTRSSICRIEAGKQPYRQWILERIATVLECTPSDLLGVDPEQKLAIFQVYSSIPDGMKPQALDVLKSFVPKKPT